MTTFQDPPYQSRRAVRASGRADDFEVDATVRPPSARTGRRAQLASATEWDAESGAAADGTSETPSAPAEPLTLATPMQPQIPVYDEQPAAETPAPDVSADKPRGRRVSLASGERHPATSAIDIVVAPAAATTSSAAPTPAVAPTPAAPTVQPARTVAAPEARKTSSPRRASSETAAPRRASSETTTPVEPAVVAEDTVAPVAAASAASPSASSAPAPAAAVTPPTDRPMTRRELREARVAAERAAGLEEVPEAIVSILNSGPIILPYLSSPATEPLSSEDRATAAAGAAASAPSARVENALAEFDELTREHKGDSAPVGAQGHPAAPVTTWAVPLEPTSTAYDVTAPPVTAEPPAVADPVMDNAIDDSDDDVIDASDKVADDTADDNAADDHGITVPAFVAPAQPPVSTRGAGHWSVAPEPNEDIESLESTITRSVGSGSALTTSALVLPSIPQSSDLDSPYLATGETMLTGSIDLPRSLGSTGVHPSQVDSSDFDLDPLDHEVPTTDSAPVRAIRAVSTHTGSNGLITSKKPQSNHMLTVLVVSSSALAVVVVGLLVAGVSTGLFQ